MKSTSSFRFLWITDLWKTLDHPRDTTLRLAEEGLKLGHKNFLCEGLTVRWEKNRILLSAQEILEVLPGRGKNSFYLGPSRDYEPSDFDQLHYRTDPPVDLAYLHPLQLLAMGVSAQRIVNPPSILLSANEKIEAGFLPHLLPPTVVTSRWDSFERFGAQYRKTVLKPLHQAQSRGVELLDWTSPQGVKKARTLIEKATARFTRPTLLQKYLPGIARGEIRLWFLNGKLLAHVRKLPLHGDFRVNIDQGSGLAVSTLSLRDRAAALQIGRHLRVRGIRLAAVDLIDGKLTDFNFTSPGLIVQMEALLGENLAASIIRGLVI